MRSRRWWLNHRDFLKSAILAGFIAVGTYIQNEVSYNSELNLELLKRIGMAALIAFISYLFKNFLEDEKGNLL